MSIEEATAHINIYIDDYKYVVLNDMVNNNQCEVLAEAYPIWLQSNPSTLNKETN
jgi:hypothetical protein